MISVIGAGPVGLYTAHLLAKKGFRVTVFEEHKEIGKPVCCSGLLTKEINQFGISLSSSTLHIFKNICIHTPKSSLIMQNKDILVDRFLFDNEIRAMAESSGVNIQKSYKYISDKNGICYFENKSELKKWPATAIIGADGPLSQVAKQHNLWQNRKFYTGIQGIGKGSFNQDMYDVNFDVNKVSDFFYWSIPESNTQSRIGVASKKNPKELYNTLSKQYNLRKTVAGLIPIYKPFLSCYSPFKHTYLVGDAGCLDKNTTAGGIIPGLISAKNCCDAICNDKDYDKLLFFLHTKLTIHHLIRNALDKFSNRDYELLVSYMNKNKIKKILESTSRDKVATLALKLILAEPRLIKFSAKLF